MVNSQFPLYNSQLILESMDTLLHDTWNTILPRWMNKLHEANDLPVILSMMTPPTKDQLAMVHLETPHAAESIASLFWEHVDWDLLHEYASPVHSHTFKSLPSSSISMDEQLESLFKCLAVLHHQLIDILSSWEKRVFEEKMSLSETHGFILNALIEICLIHSELQTLLPFFWL
eukprot:gb/GECH01012953.1/.p1 GENE.gb/GECH01012953.1/~~gb/GECH01012953.1/.p1  ORF type:complete len:174 (+),score=28.12 gb/GECH01012953.1/:1-522(+)